MAKTKTAKLTRDARPYLRRLLEDERVHDQLSDAAAQMRKAYRRAERKKKRAKAAEDKKLYAHVRRAAASLRGAAMALQRKPPPKPKRRGRKVVLVLLLAVSAVAVVLTGGLAKQVGNVVGVGSSAVTVWDIAKWPVLLLVVSFMFALLYWASPNAKHAGFRWVSPGGLFAVIVWVIASAAFAFYVANFSSYNKTYGALAGIVVFLVWLWISNIAVLLGAELNAELERGRRIEAGHPPEREPFVEPRDTRSFSD